MISPMPGWNARMIGSSADDDEGSVQDRGAAPAVGERAADRPHHRRQDDEARRAHGGVPAFQPEGVDEERREIDRNRHEAAEGQEVEQAQHPGGRLLQRDEPRGHRDDRTWPGRIPPEEEDEHAHRQHDRHEHPEGERPAERAGHRRRHQRSDSGPDVPHAVDAERHALPRGREPARDERHPNREDRPCHPEDERHAQQQAYPSAKPASTSGTARKKRNTVKTTRPPYQSVSDAERDARDGAEDDGHRHQDPGLVAVSPHCWRNSGASGASRLQTAKPTAIASVASASATQAAAPGRGAADWPGRLLGAVRPPKRRPRGAAVYVAVSRSRLRCRDLPACSRATVAPPSPLDRRERPSIPARYVCARCVAARLRAHAWSPPQQPQHQQPAGEDRPGHQRQQPDLSRPARPDTARAPP